MISRLTKTFKRAVIMLATLSFTAAFSTLLQAAPAEMPPGFPAVKLSMKQHGEAAVNALGRNLGPVAAFYKMDEKALAALLRKDHDLWVDEQGRLLYICNLHGQEGPGAEATEPAVSAALPLTDPNTFLLHSRPGASKVIYLDFDGHDGSSTQWGADAIARPFDTDSDPSTFSSSERSVIRGVWQRVAEDYAMFDVDVTTADPGIEALRKSGTSDVNYGIRVAIGGDSADWYGSAGGVAYVGSFNWNSDTPCWVFPRSLGNSEKNIAEAASHEAGHTLGLAHDGQGTTTEYYSGQGNWAPIMGVGYSKPITQWSKGEYTGANNTQDDLAKMLTYGVVYRADDAGNTLATAKPLGGPSFAMPGNIESATDVDFFSFSTGAGRVFLNVAPAPRGANLHLQLSLYNSAGGLVSSVEPTDTTAGTQPASLALTLSTGTYYVSVQGKGSGDPLTTGYSDYASIGEYTLTGSLSLDGTWLPSLAGIDYSWLTVANWLSGNIPMIEGTTARVNNNIQGDQTILLNSEVKLGTLLLGDSDGSNSFTIAPGTGGALTLKAPGGVAYFTKSGAAMDTVSAPITLASDAEISAVGSGTLTLSGPVTGPGALTKKGSGTVILDNPGAFGGATLVAEGTLALGPAATLLSADIAVEDSAVLDVKATPSGLPLGAGQTLAGNGTVDGPLAADAGSTLVPGGMAQTGTLHVNGTVSLDSARLVFDFSPDGSNDLIQVVGDVSLTGATEVQLVLPQSAPLPAGIYKILTCSGTLSGNETNLFVTSQSSRYSAALDLSVPGEIRLDITGAPHEITWVGGVAQNSWETGGPLNWSDPAPTAFHQLDRVVFGDTGLPGVINLAGALQAASVSVASTQNYTFASSGRLSGDLALTKSGTGTLTINTANDFTGTTTVSGGTLKLANAKALGSETAPLTVAAGSAVDFNGTSLGAKSAFVSGGGPGETGALLNSAGTAQLNALRFLTFTGATTLGGLGRWDVRANPTGFLFANGYALTKTGPNEIWLADLGNSGLGDILINQGTLGFEGSTTAGDANKTITINPYAKLALRNQDFNVLNKKVVLNQATVQGVAGDNVLSGSITLIGSNVVDSGSSTLVLKGAIAGGGTLSKSGTGTLSLGASNSYSGITYVSAGVLQTRNAAALGSDTAGTRIANDAQLDVNGFNLGAEPVTVSGDGIGNSGAIISTGGQQLNALRFVTLAGNTTFGGIGRWDIRANPTGSLLGNGFALTKTGPNEVWLADLGNTSLGTITVNEGTLGFRGTSTMGTSGATVTIGTKGTLAFYANQGNQLNKIVAANGGEVYNASGTNTFLGTITLTGSNSFDTATSTLLNLNGPMTGSGSFNKTGAGTLVLAANSFHSGGTRILAGTLQVGDGNTGGSLGTGFITNNSKLALVRNALWTVGNPISGSGSVQIGEVDPANTPVTGTVIFTGTNTYTGTTVVNGNGTMIALGNDQALGGGTLLLNGNGNLPSTTGLRSGNAAPRTISRTVQLGAGGIFQFGIAGTGDLVFNAPTMITDNADKKIVVDNSLTTIQSTIGNNSRIIKSGTGTLVLGANNTNAGFTVNSGILRIDSQTRLGRIPTAFTPGHLTLNGGTLQNSATLAIDGNRGVSLAVQGGTVDCVAGTTLSLKTAVSGIGSLTKAGAGILELSASNTYSGATTNTAGELVLNGTVQGSGVYIIGGALLGNGTSLAPVNVGPEGTLSPGAATSIGTLTVSNTLDLAGTTVMTIDRSTGANDLISGISHLNYGGLLLVTNLAGSFAPGDRFKLFDAASYTGAFTAITPSVPGPSLVWDTSRLALDGTLGVSTPALVLNQPEVSTGQIVLSGCGGAPGATFTILGSEDLSAPLTNWTILSSGVLDGSGCFIYTNQVETVVPTRFYTIQFGQ